MTKIYDLARELGNEVLKTEEISALMEAKKKFDDDEQAVKLLNDFTELQNDMRARVAAGHMSVEEQQSVSATLQSKSEEIKKNPNAIALFDAENKFNNMMNSVMAVIQSTISGEGSDAEGCGCGGGCSSCGGGCH